NGTTPTVVISRAAGFKPTTPQAAAGIRIDPPVSLPIEAAPRHAETAAAEPPLDPPGERLRSKGLWTGPNADSSFVVPRAHSCRLHLPTITAPASRSRATSRASAAATCPILMRDAAVVGTPLTSIR